MAETRSDGLKSVAVGTVAGVSIYAAAWFAFSRTSVAGALGNGGPLAFPELATHVPALTGLVAGAFVAGLLHARALRKCLEERAEDEAVRASHLQEKITSLTKLARDLEHALTERNHRLGEIFEGLPGEIFWVSRDLRYVRVNAQMAAAEGLYPRDFEGRPVGFTGREGAKRVRAELQEFFAGNAATRERYVEGFASANEGGARVVFFRRFRNAEDAFVVALPVVESRAAAREGRASPTEHTSAAASPASPPAGLGAHVGAGSGRLPAPALGSARLASLGEMVAGIAHEINNPLAILNGRVQVLRTKAVSGQLPNEELLLSLDKLSQTVFRVSKIITGLRSFVRPGTSGEQPEDLAPLRAIEDALDFCKGRFHKQGIRIVLDVTSRSLVRCVPVQLSQILLNLLNNALHALDSLPDKWVRIEAHDRGEEVEFRVVDNGPGVAPEIAERIFEPFFTTKDHAKGTGLGLSISRGLAESNGGELRLDSCAQPTAFVLTLPAVPDASGSAPSLRSEVLPEEFLG